MGDFHSFDLPVSLKRVLDEISPTPIQAQAIPLALKGRDILGSARTGTGKTLAFAIPVVAKLLNRSGIALVIVPTRELAQQVMSEFKKLFSCDFSLKMAVLIGGEPIFKQLNQMRLQPRVIIGTPGRIIDHINRGSIVTHKINTIVLDETDRIFDMGFEMQIQQIMKHMPSTRQTLMFSATLPENIIKLASEYLNNPERISVDCTAKLSPQIKQEVVYATELEKYEKLTEQLHSRKGSVIIFVRTKRCADRLAIKLYKDNHSVIAIHGDLQQRKRERVMNSFRRGRSRIMVATDIASRGLDVPHVQHVINYDAPLSQADYIHRIGRTARAGAAGSALSIILPQDRTKLVDKQGNLDFDLLYKKRSALKLKNNIRKRKINTFRNRRRALHLPQKKP